MCHRSCRSMHPSAQMHFPCSTGDARDGGDRQQIGCREASLTALTTCHQLLSPKFDAVGTDTSPGEQMPHSNLGKTQRINKPMAWKSNILIAFIQLRFLIRSPQAGLRSCRLWLFCLFGKMDAARLHKQWAL